MEKKSHFVPIFFLVLISVIVHHVWFLNLQPITYGDWMFNYLERVKEFFALPRSWLSDSGLGGFNFGISFWPFLFISGMIARLNINVLLLDRLLFLWPIALLLPLSMYLLSFYILRSKIAAFISALIFEFNTYIIILKSAHLTLLMAITLTPFFIFLFFQALKEKKIIYALIASFFVFVISGYEFRIFYLVCWFGFIYTIYYIIFVNGVKNLRRLFRLIFIVSIPFFLTLVLNSYSLLAIFGAKSLTNNYIFNRSLFGGWYIKLTKVITLFHFGWTGGKMIPFKVEPIQWQFLSIPFLFFLGFLVNRKNKIILFFALLGLLGIFLNKMNTPPFPHIYQWLFDYVPGFNAFRESGKFMLYVIVSYSIVIGALISWLWENATNQKQKIGALIITFLTAGIFLWNGKPIITGELGSLFVPRQIPKDYLIIKDFVLEQPEYFRTLSIPTATRWTPYNNNHPLLSSDGQTVNNLKLTNELLDIYSVKYVFIPLEDKINDDNFFDYMGKRKNFIIQLDNLKYLKKIDAGTKEIIAYENKNYRPHIYLTNQRETVKKNVPYYQIKFSSINPTKYEINIKKMNNPLYLNFSENYHPDWRMRVGEFDWFKVLIDNDYFLSENKHFRSDTGLNTFYLNPQDLCNNKSCNNISLTLYFRPQSYVYFGGIIALITLLSLSMFLLLKLILDHSKTVIKDKDKADNWM